MTNTGQMEEAAVLEALYIPGDAVCIAWRSRKREEARGIMEFELIVEMKASTPISWDVLVSVKTLINGLKP